MVKCLRKITELAGGQDGGTLGDVLVLAAAVYYAEQGGIMLE